MRPQQTAMAAAEPPPPDPEPGAVPADPGFAGVARVSAGIRVLAGVARGVMVTAVVALTVGILATVIAREVFGKSYQWGNDVSTLCLEIITFVGGAMAYRDGEMASFEAVVTLVGRWCPAGWPERLRAVRTPLVLATAGLLFVISFRNIAQQSATRSAALGLAGTWFALPLTVGLGLITVFAADTLLRGRLQTVLPAIGIAAVVVAVFWLVVSVTPTDAATSMAVGVVIIVVTLCAGVPVAFGLATGAAVYLYKSGFAGIGAVPQSMQFGVTNFLLLAIPTFLLAGFVMARAGLSARITNLGKLLVGRLPGGLLHVAIVGMYLFSGLSGSKLADVAAVGGVLKDDMREQGHSAGETSAILSAAAVMGETVPPSIPLLVLGSVTSLSIGTFLVSGIGPAALVGVCLAVFVCLQYVRRRKRARAAEAADPVTIDPDATDEPVDVGPRRARAALFTVLQAIPALLVPAILVAGIIGGFATPSEVSCVAVGVAVVLSLLNVRRIPSAQEYYGMAVKAGSLSGMVLLIVSSAQAFSFTFASSQVTVGLTSFLRNLPGAAVFLIVSVLVLIVLGTLLEGIAAVILFGPILVPVATTFGVNPYQFGILLILATGLGSFLPPFGVGVYGSCVVIGATMEETTRHLAKYVVVLLAALVIIAAVPEITVGIGHLVGLG